MTTVGYGDLTPRGYTGRCISMAWILTGLVMVSLFNSIVTFSLTASVIDQSIMLYGTRVGALANSTEFRAGILKNAQIVPYPTLEDLTRALDLGHIKGLLLDGYVANMVIPVQEYEVNRILDKTLTYGVVLAGEAVTLKQPIKDYMVQHQAKITRIIETSVKPLTNDSISKTNNNNEPDIFAVDEKFLRKTMIYFGPSLIVMVACGLVYNIYYKKELYKGIQDIANADMLNFEKKKNALRLMVEDFYQGTKKTVQDLKAKHVKELKTLSMVRKKY
ncbi:uncharacterized protein LOC116290268 [Actinia tenebrosa]|uniref:Uncharacterized protein LOC116290268 n=1 Tax=Actinia tenebrosa TaxID=6105 RepID=A0A6P8H9J3_ACTTE|nr:uncharacterized protein LOC116290268 [Actinia tenebrosa]